jgi:hypothetical protein
MMANRIDSVAVEKCTYNALLSLVQSRQLRENCIVGIRHVDCIEIPSAVSESAR